MLLTEEVIGILDDTLKLGERAARMSKETLLLGNIPELDSMAIVSVINALELHYDITVADEEIDAHVFESIGSLVDYVESKTRT